MNNANIEVNPYHFNLSVTYENSNILHLNFTQLFFRLIK